MTKKYLIKDLLPNDEVNILHPSSEPHKINLKKYMNKESVNTSLKKIDLSYWEISIPKGTNQIQIKEIHDNEN